MKMLLDEGFEFENYVDIFDAGPLVEARKEDIKTIVESRLVVVSNIGEVKEDKEYLMASGAVESFRCSRGLGEVRDAEIKINNDVAAALTVSVGDEIRIVEW